MVAAAVPRNWPAHPQTPTRSPSPRRPLEPKEATPPLMDDALPITVVRTPLEKMLRHLSPAVEIVMTAYSTTQTMDRASGAGDTHRWKATLPYLAVPAPPPMEKLPMLT